MAGRAFWAAAAGLAAAAAAACYVLYDTLFPVLLGFGLAYALGPLVDWLEARGLGRTTAVAGLMAGMAAAALLAVALVIPGLLEQARAFARGFPDSFAAAVDRLAAFAAGFNVELPTSKEQLLPRLRSWAQGLSLAALSPVGTFAARFFSSAAGFFVGLLNLLVVPVIMFYALRDLPLLRRAVLDQVPPRLRPDAEKRLDQADTVFSGYLRGQLLVACILAVLYSAGLAALGIRFGVVIGLLAGLLNVVPYVGVLTGLVLSLTMAAVDFEGWGRLAGVVALFGACQFAEGTFITPRVVGDKVGLSALETIIALILGGEFGGLGGLVLAIPVAGTLKLYGLDAMAAFRASDFFRSAGPVRE